LAHRLTGLGADVENEEQEAPGEEGQFDGQGRAPVGSEVTTRPEPEWFYRLAHFIVSLKR
jgi:hypothetical protein